MAAYADKSKRDKRIRAGCVVFLLMVICVSCLGLYVRAEATKAGGEWHSTLSENGNCSLKTYIRKYSNLGTLGRVFGLFGSQFYYRVYSRNGELQKTSEWNFWEGQLDADQSAYWAEGVAFYPTADGLKGWDLQSCSR